MRIVLDANLVVRAARPGNTLARRVLLAATSEGHSLILSNSLYFEIYKVLLYPNVRRIHRLDDAGIQTFLEGLVESSLSVTTKPIGGGPLIATDPADDHVLLTAIAGEVNVIGTNDRDFFSPEVIQLASQYGIRIWRDVDFIPILLPQ